MARTMGSMPHSLASFVLATAVLAGLPWIRGAATAPPAPAPSAATAADPALAPPPNRVAVLGAASPDYRMLAIPRSARTDPDASVRLLVFRGGICVLDRGLRDAHEDSSAGARGTTIVQEDGIIERAAASPDGREAVVVSTRYVSRVDVTPGTTSTAGDLVRGPTTLTLVDPTHPDGRWQITLEDGRWVKDVEVLPGSSGVVVTTFVPRTGPSDLRVLDALGREKLRVPESRAETVAVRIDCAIGCFVAADVKFPEQRALPERGLMVFDLAHGTSWTYSWRYGGDGEPLSWALENGGILTVKLPAGTARFDPSGRRL
jgi:hypothetical protein